MHHPTVEMGQAAAEGLLRLLNGNELILPRFPTNLIVRKSAMRVRQSE